MHDIWRSGYTRTSLAAIAAGARVSPAAVTWLPDAGPFRYHADPFAIERNGTLTVFVEHYDHRTRRGDVRWFQYDTSDALVGQGLALSEPWHLSYPQIVEEDGVLYMLPEGHKGGGLDLYVCERFPDRWVKTARLLELPAIDATVVRRGDRWWMFYALPGADDRAMRELHVASASSLRGPWRTHACNPVAQGFRGCRPGGSAVLSGDQIVLPVQDCRAGYGAAIDWLRIDTLTDTSFEAALDGRAEPAGLLPGFEDGLHTLSGSSGFTCVDVKSLRQDPAEVWMKAEYKLRRLFGVGTPRRGRPRSRADAGPGLAACGAAQS